MRGITNLAGFAALWLLLVVVTLGTALIPLALLLWLMLGGAEQREAAARRLLDGTLMPGESVVAQGVQRRVFALSQRRVALAITDSRIILVRRGLIGGFRMQDIQWKDLTDARIEQNVWSARCGSNLVFAHANPSQPAIAVDGIDSDTAATIYATAQFQEQAWEEKRRVRGMEEVRAAAGGVVVHSAPPPLPTPASAAGTSGNAMLEQILKAKELLDAGAISDVEFQEMKAKILAAS